MGIRNAKARVRPPMRQRGPRMDRLKESLEIEVEVAQRKDVTICPLCGRVVGKVGNRSLSPHKRGRKWCVEP